MTGRATRAALLLLAVTGAASAETPRGTPERIEVDRDGTPAGRVGFGFDGGEPIDAWGVSATLAWIDRPIAVGEGGLGDGTPASEPVRRRETLALGAAIAIGDSIVLDGTLRASHQVGDRLRAAGDAARLRRAVFQDVRLGLRLHVAGDRERAALLRADLTLPAGDDAQFAGDARWTAAWRLIGRLTIARVVVAANVGIRLHGAEVAVGDTLVGDELFGAAGVRVPVADALALTGELAGGLGDHVGKRSAPSPLEARAGAILQLSPALAAGAHVGLGLVDELGAPRARAMLELAWTPVVPHAAPRAAPEAREED